MFCCTAKGDGSVEENSFPLWSICRIFRTEVCEKLGTVEKGLSADLPPSLLGVLARLLTLFVGNKHNALISPIYVQPQKDVADNRGDQPGYASQCKP